MKQRHGAVIVRGGRVVSMGWNLFKNHPENVSDEHVVDGCSTHAERMALARCQKTAGATIYIARNKKGTARFSKPCTGCERAIINAGISRVVYTADVM